MDYILEAVGITLGLIFGIAAASVEFFRERNKRMKWLVAITACFLGALAGFALLYTKERRQLVDTRQANLEKRALITRLDTTLRRLDTLRTSVDAERGRMLHLLLQTAILDSAVHEATDRVGAVDRQTLALGERIRQQSGLVDADLANSQRLLHPLHDLWAVTTLAYSLKDPEIRSYAQRLRHFVDSVSAAAPGAGIWYGDSRFSFAWNADRHVRKAIINGTEAPWFPDLAERSEHEAGYDFRSPRFDLWLYPPKVTGDTAEAISFAVGGAIDSSTALPYDNTKERPQILNPTEIDFDADSLYLTFRGSFRESARWNNRILGVDDLPGVTMNILLWCHCNLRRLELYLGATSVEPLVLTQGQFRAGDNWTHEFSRRDVQGLLGRSAWGTAERPSCGRDRRRCLRRIPARMPGSHGR
ncbi:MAG: hypothetical protein JWM27_3099 [Gemmatimonadetes bacterium]|nr:hypothetical protein [Gemmatimonadota bacterium]